MAALLLIHFKLKGELVIDTYIYKHNTFDFKYRIAGVFDDEKVWQI